MAKRSTGKRELIDTPRNKMFAKRDVQGRFKEMDDVGRSLATDRRAAAETASKAGQEDRATARERRRERRSRYRHENRHQWETWRSGFPAALTSGGASIVATAVSTEKTHRLGLRGVNYFCRSCGRSNCRRARAVRGDRRIVLRDSVCAAPLLALGGTFADRRNEFLFVGCAHCEPGGRWAPQ
jgi:hypothetical protein